MIYLHPNYGFYDNIPLYGSEWRYKDAHDEYYDCVGHYLTTGSDRPYGFKACNPDKVNRMLAKLSRYLAGGMRVLWTEVQSELETAIIRLALQDDDIEYRIIHDHSEYEQIMAENKAKVARITAGNGGDVA